MSRITLATAATAALLVTAPMAQAAPFEFKGYYAGVHAGYMDVKADSSSSSGSISGGGSMGGFQAGYNFVTDNIMLGVESDFSLTDASPCCSIGVGPIGTLRPRLGYAADDWLLYVTGGVASAQFEDFDPFDGEFGWTVGAGVEYLLGDIVGVKIEYRYMRFGDVDQGIASPLGGAGIDFDMHTVMGGVNFHF
jgi:outer membrane immunogenic protein